MFNVRCALCGIQITQELQQSKDKGSVITVARMTDQRHFHYGLSGEYVFLEDLPLKDGDSVCINCMTAHKFEEYKGVECGVCHTKYHSNGIDGGDGCCGKVVEHEGKREVSCGYGSKHDMVGFVFKDGHELPLNTLVCDDCIDKMVADDKVTEDNSFWEELKSPVYQAKKAAELAPYLDALREQYPEAAAEADREVEEAIPSWYRPYVPLHITDPMKLIDPK